MATTKHISDSSTILDHLHKLDGMWLAIRRGEEHDWIDWSTCGGSPADCLVLASVHEVTLHIPEYWAKNPVVGYVQTNIQIVQRVGL